MSFGEPEIYGESERHWLGSGDGDGLLSEVTVDNEKGKGGRFWADDRPMGKERIRNGRIIIQGNLSATVGNSYDIRSECAREPTFSYRFQ